MQEEAVHKLRLIEQRMVRTIGCGVKHPFRVLDGFTVFQLTVVLRFLLQQRRCRFRRYAIKGIDCITGVQDVIECDPNPDAATRSHQS
jgi:hypothetical protein